MTLPKRRMAVLIVLVFGAGSAAALGATLGDNRGDGARDPGTKAPPPVSRPANVDTGYWTKQRMRNAKPYPMPHAPVGGAPRDTGGAGATGEPGTISGSAPSQR
jgi:hypothetical protein